jgi:uncharacterized protein with HEPN domain
MAKNLTVDFTREHGSMPWRSIKGIGIILVHRHGKPNIESRWDTMSLDIPELKKLCSEILALSARQSHDL